VGRFRPAPPGRAARLLATVAATLAAGASLSARAEAAVVVRAVDAPPGAVAFAPGGAFQMVGARWAGDGHVEARVRLTSGTWTGWFELSEEAPAWTGDAVAVETRHHGDVRRAAVSVIASPRLPADADVLGATPPASALAEPGKVGDPVARPGQPRIISRRGWSADESIRRDDPDYADGVRMTFVHHTATPSRYSCRDSAAYVRGIYAFHVKGNKWSDIGYNFLVDRCGRVFEGRFGGITKAVIGAHTLGFNTNSTGIAMIGTYEGAPPPAAAMAGLSRLIAWRLDIAHVNPAGIAWMTNRGSPSYRPGRLVRFRAVSGHRNGFPTSCPGAALYARLRGVALAARDIGGLKVWRPTRRGKFARRGPSSVRPMRFTAAISAPQYWALSVEGPTGRVWRATGYGRRIDRTWNGRARILPRGNYSWRLLVPKARGVAQGMPELGPWVLRAGPRALAVSQGAVQAGGLDSLRREGDGDVLDVAGGTTQFTVTAARPMKRVHQAAILDVGGYIVTTGGGARVDVELWDWRNGGWMTAGSCTTRAGRRCAVLLRRAPARATAYDAASERTNVRARFTVAGPVAVDESRLYMLG
jgi:hypothetical protein